MSPFTWKLGRKGKIRNVDVWGQRFPKQSSVVRMKDREVGRGDDLGNKSLR